MFSFVFVLFCCICPRFWVSLVADHQVDSWQQEHGAPAGLGTMAGPIWQREASSTNCSLLTSSCHRTPPFPDALPAFGLLSVVWMRESPRHGTRCTLHVHHGRGKAHTSSDFCCYNSSFGTTLVCPCAVQDGQPSTSMGSKILCALRKGSWHGSAGHQSGRGIW